MHSMRPGLAAAWLLSVAALAAALAIGAAPDAAREPNVIHVPAAQLRAAADLPRAGYLSTGQPDRATLEAAAAAGYAAVVDLRGAAEDRGLDEPAAVETLGMRYVALPVAGADDVSFANAARLDAILDGIDGPVLLHCASGNRVGALLALRSRAAGASDDEALAVGRRAGLTGLEPVVRERLAVFGAGSGGL